MHQTDPTSGNPRIWGRANRWCRLSRYLEDSRLPLFLALLALVLTSPSLRVGWVVDDFIHRLRMLGSPKLPEIPANPAAFFTFAGSPEQVRQCMDRGLWPWWSVETLHASFWRPLTVLTHRLDYFLWPNAPGWMHFHSMAWLALLTVLVTVLYRRFMGPTWIAGFAALAYAIDDARGMPVGFLANRNAIVATVFGVAAILAHDRWRRRQGRLGCVPASALLMASLLSAEAGIGTVAYLVAHSVCLEDGPWIRRLKVLIPYALVVVGWRCVWSLLGHGIRGVGLYVDPLTEPVRYLQQAIMRIPILLLGQLGFPPSDVSLVALLFDLSIWLWLVAVAFVIWAGLNLWPTIRKDRKAQFWALGMILSLAPICATFPGDRLLFFVGLGAFGLLALWFADPDRIPGRPLSNSTTPSENPIEWAPGRFQLPARIRMPGGRLFPGFLIVVHFVLAPIGLSLRSAMPTGPKKLEEMILVQSPLDETVEQQSVVLMTVPVAFASTYLVICRALDGLPVPKQVRLLAPYQPPIAVSRPNANTVVIRPHGGYLKNPLDQLARSPAYPMRVGQEVKLSGMTAEITEMTPDGRPAEVRFRFDDPLEAESLRWLNWNGREYAPISPPAAGESMVLD